MKSAILTLLVLLVLVGAAPAKGDRAEVLGKIETLLAGGELDEAKRMLDFFLAKNPTDPDLLRLYGDWRIRNGDLGPLLAEDGLEKPGNRARLTEICFRIVEATAPGNPEEWPALMAVRDGRDDEIGARVWAILTRLSESGTEEDRRAAMTLITPPPPAPPHDRPDEELVAALRAGGRYALLALMEVERRRYEPMRAYAKEILAKADDFSLRFAAAGALLSIGNEKPRKALLGALAAERPVEAVAAGEVLLRYPGKGRAPRRALFDRIDDDEAVGRAKPALLAMVVKAIGDAKEPGARIFLETLLGRPDLRIDAARALGALRDVKAVPALLAFLRADPPEEENAAAGGLGYLDRSEGAARAAAAEEVRPHLAGAIAILRATR